MRRWWRWRNGKVALTIICLVMSIFISEICPLKWVWKSASYRTKWNASAGQRRLWRHWKLLGMKVLIKHFKESGLSSETMLRTQRSRPFPKPEKWLIFGILTKGWTHDNFWESFIFRMVESDIFYVKWRPDEDGAMEKWLWLLFVYLWAILSLKVALQNWLEKVPFTAKSAMPLRANGVSEVTESYLNWRSWSSTSRKMA